jgi:hypothetical protein
MTPEEARQALATLNQIGVDGTDTSWPITHRDEISAAFDTLQAFVSEAERVQAENVALRQRLEAFLTGGEPKRVDKDKEH